MGSSTRKISKTTVFLDPLADGISVVELATVMAVSSIEVPLAQRHEHKSFADRPKAHPMQDAQCSSSRRLLHSCPGVLP